MSQSSAIERAKSIPRAGQGQGMMTSLMANLTPKKGRDDSRERKDTEAEEMLKKKSEELEALKEESKSSNNNLRALLQD